ncbi:uncharacterized protein LOC126635091 isoform X1 [Myiozetetes cayanensis]|uniref:uncharacterized protein LOC126635091 isoform X1 n=1 Tax=Myiozetetes cayanensis TaxID=478635 RepID=UPI00215E7831|nr:uncharacterized protein LOC126635091 isoform X1 [Myiozetetes cayanensis]
MTGPRRVPDPGKTLGKGLTRVGNSSFPILVSHLFVGVPSPELNSQCSQLGMTGPRRVPDPGKTLGKGLRSGIPGSPPPVFIPIPRAQLPVLPVGNDWAKKGTRSWENLGKGTHSGWEFQLPNPCFASICLCPSPWKTPVGNSGFPIFTPIPRAQLPVLPVGNHWAKKGTRSWENLGKGIQVGNSNFPILVSHLFVGVPFPELNSQCSQLGIAGPRRLPDPGKTLGKGLRSGIPGSPPSPELNSQCSQLGITGPRRVPDPGKTLGKGLRSGIPGSPPPNLHPHPQSSTPSAPSWESLGQEGYQILGKFWERDSGWEFRVPPIFIPIPIPRAQLPVLPVGNDWAKKVPDPGKTLGKGLRLGISASQSLFPIYLLVSQSLSSTPSAPSWESLGQEGYQILGKPWERDSGWEFRVPPHPQSSTPSAPSWE